MQNLVTNHREVQSNVSIEKKNTDFCWKYGRDQGRFHVEVEVELKRVCKVVTETREYHTIKWEQHEQSTRIGSLSHVCAVQAIEFAV